MYSTGICRASPEAGASHALRGLAKRPERRPPLNATRELPPIKVTTSDYNSLLFTAVLARRLGDQNAEFLISELTRASVCQPDDLPEHVVSTNCRVIYRLDEEL